MLTHKDPLVVIWKSKDYDCQGMIGMMKLSTAAMINEFDPKQVKLDKTGKTRVKVVGELRTVYLQLRL